MFRAKDTICITMQISIIKCWQFIFPWQRKKNVFRAALFLCFSFSDEGPPSSWSRFVV